MSIERTCAECKYSDFSAVEQPCVDCDGPNCRFKPKEEGMTSDNQAEAELEKMREELKVAQAKIEDMEHKARMHWNEMAMLKEGEVAGLKFALRCNGVSGGEVR